MEKQGPLEPFVPKVERLLGPAKPVAEVLAALEDGPHVSWARQEVARAIRRRVEELGAYQGRSRGTPSQGRTAVDLYFILQPTARYDASPPSVSLVAGLVLEAPAPGSPSGSHSPGRRTQFETLVRALVDWLVSVASNPGDPWSKRFADVSAALGAGATFA